MNSDFKESGSPEVISPVTEGKLEIKENESFSDVLNKAKNAAEEVNRFSETVPGYRKSGTVKRNIWAGVLTMLAVMLPGCGRPSEKEAVEIANLNKKREETRIAGHKRAGALEELKAIVDKAHTELMEARVKGAGADIIRELEQKVEAAEKNLSESGGGSWFPIRVNIIPRKEEPTTKEPPLIEKTPEVKKAPALSAPEKRRPSKSEEAQTKIAVFINKSIESTIEKRRNQRNEKLYEFLKDKKGLTVVWNGREVGVSLEGGPGVNASDSLNAILEECRARAKEEEGRLGEGMLASVRFKKSDEIRAKYNAKALEEAKAHLLGKETELASDLKKKTAMKVGAILETKSAKIVGENLIVELPSGEIFKVGPDAIFKLNSEIEFYNLGSGREFKGKHITDNYMNAMGKGILGPRPTPPSNRYQWQHYLRAEAEYREKWQNLSASVGGMVERMSGERLRGRLTDILREANIEKK